MKKKSQTNACTKWWTTISKADAKSAIATTGHLDIMPVPVLMVKVISSCDAEKEIAASISTPVSARARIAHGTMTRHWEKAKAVEKGKASRRITVGTLRRRAPVVDEAMDMVRAVVAAKTKDHSHSQLVWQDSLGAGAQAQVAHRSRSHEAS